jgi:hypothetical protein
MRAFFRVFGFLLATIILLLFSCPLNKDDNTDNNIEDEETPLCQPGELIITEVGSCPYTNISSWVEIYNNSSISLQLNSCKLRTYGRLNYDPYTFQGLITFDLPSLTIAPGDYILVRGKTDPDYPHGAQVVYIQTSSLVVPNWVSDMDGSGYGNGLVELISGGQTIDFVRFGSNAVAPTTTGEWAAGAASALPTGSLAYGYSIARADTNTDTNTAGDWTARDWATPGGVNDVTSDTDADGDGIPDCSEDDAGSTFAGLPLYDWGARVGNIDVFIHVDLMNSADLGVIPRKDAFTKVRDAFLNKPGTPIHLHFDLGNYFHSGTGSSPADYDLDDTSHLVPFAQAITLGVETGKANAYAYKNQYMALAKRQVFHYLIMAYSQNTDGSGGSSGLAEINGNDFICSLGNWGFSTSTAADLNTLINYQASTIMHEFGHNLGLRHGGLVDTNYMPNYYSIMNYMYQLAGLSTIGNNEGDRYYYYQIYGVGNVMFDSKLPGGTASLTHNRTLTTFKMDFSNGSGGSLNEASLNETTGLLRTGSTGIDFDASGSAANTALPQNLNSTEDGTLTTFADYNDWGNLKLFFQSYYSGNNSGLGPEEMNPPKVDVLHNDKQEIHKETLTPAMAMRR